MTSPNEPSDAESLRLLVSGLGVSAEDLDRAEREGTLGLLAIERLIVVDPPKYTQEEVEGMSALGRDARRFWRALGFADPPHGEKAFSDSDVEMLHMLELLFETRLVEREVALQMARVIGSSIARIASAQIDAIERGLATATDIPDDETISSATVLVPSMPRILEYAWRRHTQAAARRRLMREVEQEGGSIAVGFADLVGFTALAQEMTAEELARVVEAFEAIAYDTVATLGGRVIKTIGDEVMFAHEDSRQAVEIGLTLADAFHDEENVSDVRVGIACGAALEREGDIYGPTVNLASRIVSLAFPGAVVVGPYVHQQLEDDPTLVWRSMRPRTLKHIGRVGLWVVRRAEDGFERERVRDRARRQRGQFRDRMTELLDRTPLLGGDDREEEE